MNARAHHPASIRRPSRARRSLAVLGIAIAFLSGVPLSASADDFWGLWAREVRRRVWWEMPFAIAVSFPAMVVTTPFWLGTKAPGLISGGGGGEDADEDEEEADDDE